MCTRICRTCLLESTSNGYVDINRSEFARKQLTLCVPELNLDLVMEPVLCLKCVEALNAAYDFKSCCLQTEQRIQAHVQTLTIEQHNVELEAVLGNNYNGINLMALHCDNDAINDLNTVHDHSRTTHDLEDYEDAKMECSVTSESCLLDDGVEVKEESITIEEHEWDSFSIKSEVLDTSSDAEINYSLQQWSEFENRLNLESQDCNRSCQKQNVDSNEHFEARIKMELDTELKVAAMQSEHNYASAGVSKATADDIFLPEPSNCDDFERHNASLGKISTKSSGLLQQYNELGPVNYNENDENCNSATISAESFTKQGTCATSSHVGVVSMAPNSSSSSVGLLRQVKGNVMKIADPDNIYSIKRRFKNISSIKSHSRINKLCKRVNRRVLYRSRRDQKEKNIVEQIVAKAGPHSVLVRDCRVVLTRMDISNAEDILNVDSYAVIKGVETQVKKSSHLKCDTNIKNNNTAATEAGVDLHRVIDRSQLHLKHSNTPALSTVQVKNQELSISSKFLNTIGKKPYKCVRSDNACSRKDNLIKRMRKHTGEKPYKCEQCDYASSTKGNLIIHIRKHTGEKPYKCDQCDYASSEKGNLIIHMRTHTGEKPYKCDQCDYASSEKSKLITHVRKHTGEKPYKCEQCDYASSQKYNLIIHMRKHTGEKPYKCEQCDYACSTKGNLIIHIRKHTEDKPYKCSKCDYAFSQKNNLITHMRKHTGEKPYKCDQCDYASSEKRRLIAHIRKHTGEKP